MFSTSALSGMTTLPVIMNSTIRVTNAMMIPATGSRPEMPSLESTSVADGPDTRIVNGARVSRMLWTSFSPCGE